jgi:CxxC motif-containing protein
VTVVDGAACGRGTAYARQECVNPTRVLTTLVRVRGRSAPLSVKTARPVPKEKLFACLEELRHIQVEGPVHIGDVVLRDVCGTGVDIVATMELGVGGGGTR